MQPKNPISMPSASMLGSQNNIQAEISRFSGAPAIALPLYEFHEGNLNLGLTMSYDISGIRPDVHPGWVGRGWFLRAGVITRKVNIREDELPAGMGGFYDNYTKLAASDWSTLSKLQGYTTDALADSPDEFSFQVNGISGRFFLDHERNWQVQCDQDVKVLFDAETGFSPPFGTTSPPDPYAMATWARVFRTFTLLGPDGTKYVFGGQADAVEYSIDFFSQYGSPWTATSWHLTKIVSVDGIHEINLSYERDHYTNVLYNNIYANNYTISLSGSLICSSNGGNARSAGSLGGNLLSPVYLSSITTGSEQAIFTRSTSVELRYRQAIYDESYQVYNRTRAIAGATTQETLLSIQERLAADTVDYKFLTFLRQNGQNTYPAILNNLQWKQLDRIDIKDVYNDKIFRRFDFRYTADSDTRLSLEGVKQSGFDETGVQESSPDYKFYYDQSVTQPAYLSGATDEWGYYTGNVPNSYTQYRPPSVSHMKEGALTKIVYPTGGVKMLYYEPNDFSLKANDDHLTISASGADNRGGGLRVKAIYDYDPSSEKVLSTHFDYRLHYATGDLSKMRSSGVIGGMPKHLWEGTHTLPSGHVLQANLAYRYMPLPEGVSLGGEHVGYSEVTEIAADGSFTVYRYTNYDDNHPDEGVLNSLFTGKSGMNAFTSLALERGKLKSVEQYHKNGTRHKVTRISYAPLHGQRNFIRAFDARRYWVCNYGASGALSGPIVYEGGAYKIYTYSYLPKMMTDSIFESGSDTQVNRVRLFYDNTANKLNTRTEIIRANGKKQTDLRLYPQDYASGTTFIDAMVSKGLLAFPVEEVSYLTDTITNTHEILRGDINTYLVDKPYLKDKTYRLEIPSDQALGSFKFSNRNIGLLPYQGTSTTYGEDGRYKLIFSNSYDSFGNLIQVDRTDGPPVSTLWGYNGKLMLASASNAKSSEVFYQGFEELVSGTSTEAHAGLRSGLLSGSGFSLPAMPTLGNGRKYRLSFWYKQGSSSWSYSTQLYSNLPATISGHTAIDEVRIHPEDAVMQTLGYATSRGVVTYQGDERGRVVRYAYDPMGRLARVSDNNRHVLEDRNYYSVFAHSDNVPVYFSTIKSASYQRNNCTGGRVGESYTYLVPAGKYYSMISQADADQKAQAEVVLNGQTAANLCMECVFRNTVKQQTFYRQYCPVGEIASPYVVTIPAGRYSSTVSQAEADQMAQLEVETKGAEVNLKGECVLNQVTFVIEHLVGVYDYPRQLVVTLTNSNTSQVYSSGILNMGQIKTMTLPPGIYNATYSVGGPIGSMRIHTKTLEGSVVEGCYGYGVTVPVYSLAGWTVTLSTKMESCPPPP
ncbi:hypothetical protein GCM10011418_37190 [Sphingobacterium alkalisoli]|nr:hypothetical protein GCM10011418_37190 [Sphingobacterium alkalisoli]